VVTIVDYGMGNLRSVAKAVEKVGYEAEITSRGARIETSDRLILPGVGAFRDAIGRLREEGLVEPILRFLERGRPFLGVCLGMQLLFEKSFEDGEHQGLGVLPGDVVRFDPPRFDGRRRLKVPHMGWNQLRWRRRAPIAVDAPPDASVYFVHSYYVRPRDPDVVAAETDYGGPFASMIWIDNIFAAQFHPEKSQRTGLAMLKRFAELH
jgi:glutamine amidotransferase